MLVICAVSWNYGFKIELPLNQKKMSEVGVEKEANAHIANVSCNILIIIIIII